MLLRPRSFAFALIITLFALTSCSSPPRSPAEATEVQAAGGGGEEGTPVPEPAATETPVPTSTPTPTITPWVFPTAAFLDPSSTIPDVAKPVLDAFGADTTIMVLLGSDWMPHRGEGHDNTDAFMVAILNSEADMISLISLPRDLYVFIPGVGMGRINTAFKLGGEQMVADTIRYNFGLPVQHYAFIRIAGMVQFIDSELGGLDVEITQPVYEKCGKLVLDYLPGTYHMDGWTTVCYARVRMLSNDYARMGRQQEVVLAIRKRLMEIAGGGPADAANLAVNLAEAWFGPLMQYDLGVADIFELAPKAYAAQNDIRQYSLVPPLVTQWTHPVTGSWLLLPPSPACTRALMDAALLGAPWLDGSGRPILSPCQ